MQHLDQPATVDLTASASIVDMAAREGWQSDDYARALANKIRNPNAKFVDQRERLAALAGMGLEADTATAFTLSQHLSILEALFLRFSGESENALQRGGHKSSEIAERYLGAAVRAQGAALRVLSAMKALRDTPSPSTLTTSAGDGLTSSKLRE